MTRQEIIFSNIKSLKTIASIEASDSSAYFINDILSKKSYDEKSPLANVIDTSELNLEFVNQLYKLKLLLKDAEIAVLLDKIEENNEITFDSNLSELTKVNSVMRDIKMAISNAKEDISANETQELNVSLAKENKNEISEIKLSQEIKHYIEKALEKILRENLDNIMDEIMDIKKEKKSKVLDLSDVTVNPKVKPKT